MKDILKGKKMDLIFLLHLFLLFTFSSAKIHKSFHTGSFQTVDWKGTIGIFSISSNREQHSFKIEDSNGRILFTNPTKKAFLGMELATHEFEMYSGLFKVHDGEVLNRCNNQVIFDISMEQKTKEIQISGKTECPYEDDIFYSMIFSINKHGHLEFSLTVDNFNPNLFNEAYLVYDRNGVSQVAGLGIQSTYYNLLGHQIEGIVSEHGVGRGSQPISTFIEKSTHTSGHPTLSYAPIPFYLTDQGIGLFLDIYKYFMFDFTNDDHFSIQLFVDSPVLIKRGVLYSANSQKEIITEHTKEVGRMDPLPDHFLKGFILGVQGGTDRVLSILKKLEKNEVEVSGIWCQDWVGVRNDTLQHQKRLQWNWDLQTNLYSNFDSFINELDGKNIKFLSYINPFFVDSSEIEGFKHYYYQIGVENNYFLKDKYGNDYQLDNATFNACLLDLTNFEAYQWGKTIVKRMITEYFSSGFMLDFGEYVPMEGVVFKMNNPLVKNLDVSEIHNIYPELWQSMTKEAIEELGLTRSDIFYFTRSGFSKSPNLSASFWAGDQLTFWDQFDGLKSALITQITSGVSGISNIHSDIGGYTSFSTSGITIKRTKQLLWRWAEVSAFSMSFRSHEGMDADDNYQVYDDDETMQLFSRLVKIYNCHAFYRKELMQEAQKTGIPPMRHLSLEYPNDKHTKAISYQQYLLGSDILVAPILDKNVYHKTVYIPEGEWEYLWDGKIYENGYYKLFSKEYGNPIVFVKKNSLFSYKFKQCISNI